jgi:ferrous iron transport protein A
MVRVVQPLTALRIGTGGVVVEMRVNQDTRSRLMELGLLAGTRVELVRFAPLGDPLEVKIRGYNLTLRRHEADLIFVSCPEADPAGAEMRG